MEPIDITQLIQAVIVIMFGIITRFFVPWVKETTTERQQKNIKAVFQMVVEAAEQMFKGEGRGQEKFEYVTSELEKRGIKVDKNMIESTVLNLKNKLFEPLPLIASIDDGVMLQDRPVFTKEET